MVSRSAAGSFVREGFQTHHQSDMNAASLEPSITPFLWRGVMDGSAEAA